MTKSDQNKSASTIHTPFQQTYFHGTKADLKLGVTQDRFPHDNFCQDSLFISNPGGLDFNIWEI